MPKQKEELALLPIPSQLLTVLRLLPRPLLSLVTGATFFSLPVGVL